MDRSRKFSSLLTALAMACLFTAACDSGTQEPPAPDTAMPVTQQDDATPEPSVPRELAEGSTATIPEEFPNEIPIYPGAMASQGKGTISEGVPMAAVQLETSDSPEEVYEYYKDQLNRNGWTIQEREGLEGKNAVSATNGKCTATIMAAPADDGGTLVFLLSEC
jgi:hypothetical protein